MGVRLSALLPAFLLVGLLLGSSTGAPASDDGPAGPVTQLTVTPLR